MNKKTATAIAVGIVLVAAYPLLFTNPYYVHLAETILIYAILLFGLDIVVGYTGQVSLGHAGLFGVGSYVTGVLVVKLGVAWYLALPASISIAAVFGAILALPAMTDKDHKDLAFALRLGVDWVALSFVQRPEDAAQLKKLVEGRAACLAKIEKPSAIDCLDEILDYCDGLMVARGDLGVEMEPEDVPVAQKTILRAARRRGAPVIV